MQLTNVLCFCVCVKCKTSCYCLCSSSCYCFSASSIRDLGIVNRIPDFKNFTIWWIEAVSSAFSRCRCKKWYKNWYLHFYKTYNHQIWQAGTSTEFDSNEINQAGAGDVISSRSRDKLNTLYLLYQSTHDHQTL